MKKALDLDYERALLARLLRDETAAYREIYRETFPMVVSLVLKNSGSRDDTEEVLQEGFVVLIRMARRTEFVLTCRVGTLLFSICRLLCLKELERRQRRKKLENDFPEFETVALPDFEILVPDGDESKMDCACQTLEALGEGCRQIILWAHFEELSHQKIAEKLDSTAGYARVKLHRCMENWRKKINECLAAAA